MQAILHALATLAALLVPLTTIIGLAQSRSWPTLLIALVLLIAFAIGAWLFHTRRRAVTGSLEIEGISIDSINAANSRRRINRTLMVQTAEHTATIDGGALEMIWRYTGFCRSSETAMEFSIDSTNPVPFEELECAAFDLRQDADRQHPIRPLLIGPNGISKKIAIPFLKPLATHEPFDLMLNCRLPGTYTSGICYYTSTLSFDQNRIGHCSVNLRFIDRLPSWVRVYTISENGRPKLVRSLYAQAGLDAVPEYRDVIPSISAQSTRIYMFKLDTV